MEIDDQVKKVGQPLSTIINNFFAPLVAITMVVIANIVSNVIDGNWWKLMTKRKSRSTIIDNF